MCATVGTKCRFHGQNDEISTPTGTQKQFFTFFCQSPAWANTGQCSAFGQKPSTWAAHGTTDVRPFPALLCHMCANRKQASECEPRAGFFIFWCLAPLRRRAGGGADAGSQHHPIHSAPNSIPFMNPDLNPFRFKKWLVDLIPPVLTVCIRLAQPQ
jgi:hypothetical protein